MKPTKVCDFCETLTETKDVSFETFLGSEIIPLCVFCSYDKKAMREPHAPLTNGAAAKLFNILLRELKKEKGR